MQHVFAKPTRILIAALLTIVMLCAQWAGVQHRIVHAGGQSDVRAMTAISVAWNDSTGHADHSCIAFDAAMLGDTSSIAVFAVPVIPNLHVLSLWIAFASWDAPPICHFSSRAPPAI